MEVKQVSYKELYSSFIKFENLLIENFNCTVVCHPSPAVCADTNSPFVLHYCLLILLRIVQNILYLHIS